MRVFGFDTTKSPLSTCKDGYLVGPCFDCLKTVGHQLQRRGVLFTIPTLAVNPQEVIVLGGLVAKQDAYDVRREVEFSGQGGAGSPQVVSRPTARTRPFEGRL